MNCDELVDIWLKRWPRESATSNRQLGYMTKEFGQAFAGRPLDSITREEAREWGLRHPGRIPALRAAFNDALRDNLVPSNPFAALRITRPRKERYFPSTEEVQDLIRAAESPLGTRIQFAAYTGLRLGETMAMRPCDFNEDRSRCRVQWQMNPQDRRVPPKGNVKDHWANVPFEAKAAVGFSCDVVGWEERLWRGTRAEHNKEWNALRKRLKLPENFVWHSLRHHAATWFLDQGASFEDVAIQLGHGDNGVQVRETYGHMSREKALDRLEAVVGE